jgi:hypothetical protein
VLRLAEEAGLVGGEHVHHLGELRLRAVRFHEREVLADGIDPQSPQPARKSRADEPFLAFVQ